MVSGLVGRVIHVGAPSDPIAVALEHKCDLQVTHVATPSELRVELATPCDAIVWSHPTDHEAIIEALGAKCVHELGNYIGAVLAYGELLSRAELPADVRDDVVQLREAAREAARLLRAHRKR